MTHASGNTGRMVIAAEHAESMNSYEREVKRRVDELGT